MYSTHEAELDLPALPFAARHVHIVPALSHVSLLSIGQLCDSGCHVTFDAVSVTVHHHERLLLTGERTPATGLWHLSLVPPDVAYTARAVEPPPRRVASLSRAPRAPLLSCSLPPQASLSHLPTRRYFRRPCLPSMAPSSADFSQTSSASPRVSSAPTLRPRWPWSRATSTKHEKISGPPKPMRALQTTPAPPRTALPRCASSHQRPQ
ncbi:hypothetical protein MHU86_16096 [Fragilaria crotonensis]|nr:hypothetical protein MHU86_16096 [Fragilaria crotonensis]